MDGQASVRLINGRLEFTAGSDPQAYQWLVTRKWLTPHPRNPGVWMCYPFKEIKDVMRREWLPLLDKFHVKPGVLDYIRTFTYIKEREQRLTPRYLDGITLEDYQETSLQRMCQFQQFCIFLGPGTGKTLIALSFLNSLNTTGIHVVFTPKKVIAQYAREAKKYLDDSWEICVRTLPSTNKALVIVNYESLKVVANLPELESLILDESHRVKSPTSLVNNKMRKLAKKSKNTYLFTGTPMDKHTFDVFGQLSILNENLMGSVSCFKPCFFDLDDYDNPIDENRPEVLEEVIARCSFGGDTKDLLDLPERREHILYADAPPQLYKELDKKHIVRIEDSVIVADNPGVRLMKLLQLCSGHVKDELGKTLRTQNPKEKVFLDLIPKLPHAIIYTRFDEDIRIISELLDSLGRSYVCVNGKTKDSGPLIDNFKAGEVDFLVIQSQSGNAGLDLTNTNNIVFYSLPLAFIVYEQCLFRIWRRGQTLDCNYFILMVPKTKEVQLLQALRDKKNHTALLLGKYKGEHDESIKTNHY